MKKIYAKFLIAFLFVLGIVGANAQNVTVTGALVGNGSYLTLSAAFTAINGGVQTGATIAITIDNSTTEPTVAAQPSAVLNAGAWTSISIQPAGGTAKTVSGAATAGFSLIDFNGADNVTVDGLNTGGNALTISNTTTGTTSGTSTIRFVGGATNNIITNCSVLGSATMAVGTNGGNIYFATDALTGNGNDNNTISNNNIGPVGANLPSKGIYGSGSTTTTAIGNSGNIINNNNIFDIFGAAVASAGIYINGGCNTWSITNNRIYQTATRTWTTGASHFGINIQNTTATSGAQGFTVTGNIIGYASSTQTGTYTLTGLTGKFVGILFNGITGGTVSNIDNNTIASVSLTGVTSSGTSTSSPFSGIIVTNGVVSTNSNTIGSQSATGSLTFSTNSTSSTDAYGIYSFASDSWTANSNNIGGISVTNAAASGTYILYGIRANLLTTLSFTANSNNIGGTIANSIQLSSTGAASQVIGLITSNAGVSFTSNTIRNLTNNNGTGTGTTASVIGIAVAAASANHTVSQNSIHTLSNTNATAAVTVNGLNFSSSTGTNLIARNIIHSLSIVSTSATASMSGINVIGGTATYQNNMIRLGVDASGAALTNGFVINGINESVAGIDNFYFNSVYIGGTGVGGSANTYAFQSTITTNTRFYRNNIFYNARSNGAGTGKHYAVRVGGTAPNPAGLTINNNIYLANGTGGVFGFFNSLDVANLGAWQTAVGQDANSFSSDPQYLTPNGTSATVDLHINTAIATQVEGNGVNIPAITDDYDGQARASFTPEDIGADAGNFTTAGDINAPSITYTALTFTCATGDRALNGVIITDASGVPTAGALQPRIYYKNGVGGTWFSSQGTLATGTGINGTWDFTIVAADMGGVVAGDVIYYYVIAQDIAGIPNIAANPGVGLVATDVNTVTTPPTTPNTYNISATLAGPYNVGAGQTYTSIGAAVAAYNTSCLGGAVTFLLTDATYSGETLPLTINANPDASAINTLTIKPTQAATSISGTSASAIFVLNGADYVTIDGSTGSTANTVCPLSVASRNLTITNTNASTSSAVVWMQTNVADGATNNTVKNCNLTGNGVTQTLFGVGSGSTTISTSSLGTGNNNNSFVNNNISAVQYGIYSQGASAGNKNSGTTINQNLVNTSTATKGGIWVGFENNILISGNTISNISQTGSPDVFGITLGMGTAVSATTSAGNEVTDATVTNNIIGSVVNSGTFSAVGIAVASATSGTSLLANNMISGVASNGTGGDFGAGIILGGGTGSATNVYYNTVSMQGTIVGGTAASQASACLAVTNATAPTLDLRNNIFSNTQVGNAGATLRFVAIGLGYTSTLGNYTGLTSNNNDLYSAGAGPGTYFVGTTATIVAGTTHAALANWTTETGRDGASVSVAPVFNSATDLHLVAGSNPTINDAGTPVSVTVDIDCTTRNATTPDMGADEFTPVADDAGVTAIVLPATFCPGLQTIQATIKNYGTATLTSVLVDWTVTPGGAQPQVNPAINLAPGASATITLGTFTFVAGTTYSITATTSLPNGNADGNTLNDAFTLNGIQTGLSGNYNVGAGGDFLTLTAAAIAYNTRSLCGPVVFTLTDATYSAGETFPIAFNLNPNASAVNTLTILPNTTVSVTGASTTAAISLNGGQYITIDGRIGGVGTTHSLTVTNTAATTSPAVLFINDAVNNTVRYTDLKSDNTTTTSGVIFFSTTTGGNGNDNNTIDNCNVGPNVANPTNGIYSSGTTALPAQNNSNNTISNNNIFDYFAAASASAGVNIVAGNTDWTITGNSLYQTATRTTTGSNTHNGINISSGSGYTVSGNFIGGGAPAAAGTAYTFAGAFANRFIAINLASVTGTTSSIQGNTITNFVHSTTSGASTTNGIWCGINVTGTGNTDIGNTTLNTIGSGTGNGAITTTSSTSGGLVVGINVSSTGTLNISNNVIGSITANGSSATVSASISGIQITGGTTPVITNNIIGSTVTANSLNSPTVATSGNQLINGISVSNLITTNTTITGNTIANLNQSGTTTAASIRGIIYGGIGLGNISSNLIHDISGATANTTVAGGATGVTGIIYTGTSPSGALISLNTVYAISATNPGAVSTVACGIGYSNPSSGIVTRNRIYDIRNASTGITVTAPPMALGILIRAALTDGTFSNNMISLGNGQTTNTQFVGIINSFSTNTVKIYYNSVNIEGTATAGALPSFCFLRGDNSAVAVPSPVDIRNNIFNNTRTGGTGSHYAIGNNYGATASTTGWGANASNYNVLNANAATVGYWTTAQTFAGWQTASASDANSLTAIPVTFVNTATGDLHLNMGVTPTQLESGGIVIPAVTIDYDNDARPGPAGSVNGGAFAPDFGADEFDGVYLDLIAPVITYTPLGFTCDGTVNRVLTATITDVSGVPTAGIGLPVLYWRINAGVWNAATATFVSGNTYTFSFGIGAIAGDVIQYYIVAQDNAAPPNVGAFPSAGAAGFTIDPPAAATPPSTPSSYAISTPLSGTYTVGGGGAFATLTAAVNAYNSSCLNGAVVFSLIDPAYTTPAETFPIVINANSYASAVNTLTIMPASGVTASITGSSAVGIIKLNGADYVTIDGSNNGSNTKDLTISNSNTGTSSVVVWVGSASASDGATNNTVKNSIISGNAPTTTFTGIMSSSGTTVGGVAETANANNTYSNNTINTSYYGMAIVGPAGNESGTVISGNLIGSAIAGNKIGMNGIAVFQQQDVSISNNTISGITRSVADNNAAGIFIAGTISGGTVNANNITDIKSTNTGGYAASGLLISSTSAVTNMVFSNNFISDVAGYGWAGNVTDNGHGIYITSGGGYKFYYNSVNMGTNQTVAGNTAAFYISGAAVSGLDIRNNIFRNAQTTGTRYAIYTAGLSTAFTSIDHNDYSSTQNVGYLAAPLPTFANWQAATAQDLNSINILPNFVSATDLHLLANNCGLDGYGTPIAGTTTDYDTQPRDAGAPDMGADEFTATYGTTLAGVIGSAICDNKNVSATGTTYANSVCDLIARVLPSGGTAVSGKINVCVTLDAAQQYFNGEPYVQRHHDISPITNPTTSTATISLYFTDAEFISYNTLNPVRPPMPTSAGGGSADPDRANVLVTVFFGTPTTTPSQPGFYTIGTRAVINPLDANITWNGNYWTVTFDVTGFGGYYVHSNIFGAPLPISINYFTGVKQGSNHLLNWKVTCNSTPRATMILERSADSRNFTPINTITADAARCNQPFDHTDAQPLPGMNYYRLKMIDDNGAISYSGIVALLNAVKGFDIISIAPNPVTTGNFKLNITSATAVTMQVIITDMQGRTVSRQSIPVIAGFSSIPMNAGNLAAGTYTIQAITGGEKSRIIRFVKQ